jgi:hypothetical protein
MGCCLILETKAFRKQTTTLIDTHRAPADDDVPMYTSITLKYARWRPAHEAADAKHD